VINCLVIDDEPLALDLMESYISKISFLSMVARSDEPLLALQYFEKTRIDLLFLDIQMPDITGIEFYRSLPEKPKVIFTTAFESHAIEGFELHALDYLLKPISFERFVMSVNRARDYIEVKKNPVVNERKYFFLNASHKIHKIFYNDILYLEGLKDYTKIYLEGSKTPLLILQNLKQFEETLPKEEFVRIHRSYIIPVGKLNTIAKKMVVIGDNTIPMSDNYKENLFALIHK
jgi:two-component system LytT family response regulator